MKYERLPSSPSAERVERAPCVYNVVAPPARMLRVSILRSITPLAIWNVFFITENRRLRFMRKTSDLSLPG